ALLDLIMDSGYSYHMKPMFDILFDFLECDGGSVLLGDNRECKIRDIGKKLDIVGNSWKEGYTIKLQSGKVKVINGSRVALSRTRRENCLYSLDGHAMAGRHTTQRVIDYVHSDLWGSLRFKHKAFEKFKNWKKLVENLTRKTVKKLRTNNALEFYNQEFEELCIESGIARHLSGRRSRMG
nr:zinc finger, CCHC-type [Tanacetum cinerariifolium]